VSDFAEQPRPDLGFAIPPAALAAAADSKQGESTAVLGMADTLGVTDAFVITSGRNSRQVRTIVEEVERAVKEEFGRSPRSVEGLDDFGWVLMDYGDFVVHVFLGDRREYYDLERLWAGTPKLVWTDGTARPVGRIAQAGYQPIDE
jgi:ribosome-associated protein